MANIIDGKDLADKIQADIARQIHQKKLRPNLAVILVGDDTASKIYVGLKKQASAKVGVEFHGYLLNQTSTTEEVVKVINFLNDDDRIDAILVQLPLPKHINTEQVITTISPAKDVDGFHPENIKKFLAGRTELAPGLPLGIIRLIESTGENIDGASAVIIAKSKEFYGPLRKLLHERGVVTKIVKANDTDIKSHTGQADILIAAWGRPFFVTADMIKNSAIVVDVGINKVGHGNIVGDVDYSEAFEKAGWITPVPGGVGPMTVAMLLLNTLKLAENKKERL